MSEAAVLCKIHEDLELLKRDMATIKEIIEIVPEVKEEIQQRVQEARARIVAGKFVRNEEILKEFGIE